MQAAQRHSTELCDVNQLGFPSEVTAQEIARKSSLGGAIELCAEAAGLEPKQIQAELRTDKAQWSRWTSGGEGITWEKFVALMDLCGNDAPLLWMVHARGYDIGSLRRRETETERENRLLRERIATLEHERDVERRLFRDLRAPA
jgi:hypothetical protein